ncbi:hypothetical protein [Hafnia alvei]|uniref:hypothetical protein n=1 Tax=Hafnia alvei TaxID=569 RepID=UPI00061D153E|nr:hypothetical protein [Hafnia alvei]KKF38913.1 hypothetical protein PU01_20470 [Hafnia alvei]MBW3474333.1 AsnC family protein [Hafnia alvei]
MHLKPIGIPGKCPAHLRAWTENDDSFLIAMHPYMVYAQIAKALNRSISATKARAAILRKAGRLPYKHHFFTPEQDNFIRRNRHSLTVVEIAKHLGKSRGTITHRIRILNVSLFKCGDLHPCTKYTDKDVELIHALRDEGLTFREIGEKFEISPDVTRGIYCKRLTACDAIARDYLPR